MNLYYLPTSPPCRAVLLLGRILGLDFNLRLTNIQEGEHMKKDFLELNPTHTIPTLEVTESGLVLWESRVILTYLVSSFGKSEHENLYPVELQKRALVDLHLQFDLSTLYQRTVDYFFPTISLGALLDESKKARLVEALGFFEALLKNKKFSTGDDFTLADLSLCVTVSQIEAFNFDLYPFPKIRKWLAECKNELQPYGYAEINESGNKNLAWLFDAKLKAAK
ncbi:CLUMA_CG020085, isoform A [Clunio marinus]|uniref:glutathione transferase n=1 Tax=Clunio marinus TaxID=568069 RepID=A0A1J1J6I2_9DIPT|nr:CLUMA_CG020085, isoform A [Clunio marinus]